MSALNFRFFFPYPEFRRGFEKRYYSCHCEPPVWVSFFRHEEAHVSLPANGKEGGGLMAEPPVSEVREPSERGRQR